MAKENASVLKNKAYYNEKVKVKLFKDDGKYKDDVFVAVNGVGMIVPRGKEVEIPRKFAIALENAQAQTEFAFEYMKELAKEGTSPELN
jgi:hypothetical protein